MILKRKVIKGKSKQIGDFIYHYCRYRIVAVLLLQIKISGNENSFSFRSFPQRHNRTTDHSFPYRREIS